MDTALIQYGALGAFCAVAGAVVKILYGRLVKDYEREQQRADRLETELKALNEMLRTQYTATISDATRAIGDALAVVRRTQPP